MKIIKKLSKIFLLGLMIAVPAQGMNFIKNYPLIVAGVFALTLKGIYSYWHQDQEKLNEELYKTIRSGNLEKTKELINQGANIKYYVYGESNRSMLYPAILSKNLDLIKYLVEKHKLSLKSVYSKTTWEKNHPDMDVIKDECTLSALGVTLSDEEENSQIIKYLISKGSNLECIRTDKFNQTDSALFDIISWHTSLETIKCCVEYGAKLNPTFPFYDNGKTIQETYYDIATRLGYDNIAAYLQHVQNYKNNGTEVIPWPENINYFRLATVTDNTRDMRDFIKSSECKTLQEDIKDLMIITNNLNKQSLYELLWLLKLDETKLLPKDEKDQLSIDKKKICSFLIQKNLANNLNTFQDVLFVYQSEK